MFYFPEKLNTLDNWRILQIVTKTKLNTEILYCVVFADQSNKISDFIPQIIFIQKQHNLVLRS